MDNKATSYQQTEANVGSKGEMVQTPFYYGLSILTRILSYSVLGLIIGWTVGYKDGYDWSNTSEYYGGKRFNIHPFVMVLGTVVCYTEGVLSWGLPFTHRQNKFIHFPFMAVGLVLILFGLGTVITVKQDIADKHFYSMHSWLGIITILLYVLNAVGGIIAFLLPEFIGRNVILSDQHTAAYLPTHAMYGMLLSFMIVGTIWTGINNWTYVGAVQLHSGENILANFTGIAALMYLLSFGYTLIYRARDFSFRIGLQTPQPQAIPPPQISKMDRFQDEPKELYHDQAMNIPRKETI